MTSHQYYRPIIGTQADYHADTGDDIAAPIGSIVVAPADMRILYSEGAQPGQRHHTPWVASAERPHDTPGCVLGELAIPLLSDGRLWPYMWFCHLSSHTYHIRSGIDAPTHVPQGFILGRSGIGNNNPHLHFGIAATPSQGPGEYMAPARVASLVDSWPIHPNCHPAPAPAPAPAPKRAS